MTTIRLRLLTGMATTLLAAGTAHAQSAPTCLFDAINHVLIVNVNGVAARLSRTVPGQIRLNGADCTGATVANTDVIIVNGSDFADPVIISGSYEPGLSTEPVGESEIEWNFDLGLGIDSVRIDVPDVPAIVTFMAPGIDVNGDGDVDVPTEGIEKVRLHTGAGADTIDATAYIDSGLYIWGGGGNDTIYGSTRADWLYGEAGADILYGGDGNDKLYGGADDDAYYGDGGNDTFYQENTLDGADDFFGGDGNDLVSYAKRGNAVNVSIGNGLEDDGEAGELDFVDVDVEKATGGSGDDVLVGSSAANTLTGNAGADELYGEAGNDTLKGGAGADLLVGDAGGDKLYGGAGGDDLDGGAGRDQFFGEGGNDDFINADGVAETVDCGVGLNDDPEPEGLDTFIDCELI